MKLSKLRSICFSSIIICLCSFASNAQDDSATKQPNQVTSLNKLRLNILGLGFEREQKIGRTTTFFIGGGFDATFLYQTEYVSSEINFYGNNNTYIVTPTTTTSFKIFPAVSTGLRHYYNFERRIKKGKKTMNNAGGYVALDITSLFPINASQTNYQLNIGPMWGFQTNMSKKSNFELCLGPSAFITEVDTYYDLRAKVSFNFML